MRHVSGHYTDIHSIFRGQVGGRRAVQSITDDDGHYSDIHGIIPQRASVRSRSSGHYHYIDIDRDTADSRDDGEQPPTDPDSEDQAARPRSYEGLDPSDLAALRQPQRPHDYVGLGTGETADSTQETTEEIEMTERDQQDTVRHA